MARLFDDLTGTYLTTSSVPVSAVPLTMCAWIYPDDLTNDACAVILFDDSSNYTALRIEGGATPAVRAWTRAGGSNGYAESTASLSVNTWHHVCGVWAATDDRRAFLDGGNKGTESTNLTPSTPTDTYIATLGALGLYVSGRMAEVAIYNAALSDSMVTSLSLGYSPLLIQPADLVAYWPLIRDEDQDRVGGYDLTPQNSPIIATHPPKVFYPAPPLFTVIAAAAVTDAMPMAMHYYRTMRA